MSKSEQKPKRVRLSPEERKDLILEAAADFIRKNGVTPLSMDRLARESGHSKPLIYAYFNSRVGLLKALLVREVEARQADDRDAVARSANMDELIRNTARVLLEHVEKSGSVVQQLMLEPEVAAVLTDMRSQAGQTYISYLSKRAAEQYGIPEELAPAIVESVFGIGTAAGNHFDRTKRDIDQMEDIMVTLSKGALAAAGRKYGKKTKKS